MSENPWIPLLELTGTFKIDDLPEFDTEQLLERAAKGQDDAEKEINYSQTVSEMLEGKMYLRNRKNHWRASGSGILDVRSNCLTKPFGTMSEPKREA